MESENEDVFLDWILDAEYLGNLKDKQKIEGVVLIKKIRQAHTKRGDEMAFVTVEDYDGNTLDLVLFVHAWYVFKNEFKINDLLFIIGKAQLYKNKISMILKLFCSPLNSDKIGDLREAYGHEEWLDKYGDIYS